LRRFAFTAQFFRAMLVLTLAFSAAARIRAQTSHDFVGRVEGRDFVIENTPGTPLPPRQMSELLTSGNRLVVHSGQARILLEGGGDIVICGATELQVLKAQGSLTIALDYGTLRVHVKKSDPVAVFTPLVLATTVAIGGGERDVTVGLEQTGQMCVRAISGAVRVGQQLSGENLLVPQFGGLTLSGGQINAVSSSAPGCDCEVDSAKLASWRPNVIQQTPGATAARDDSAREIIRPSQIASPLPQQLWAAAGTPPSLDAPVFTVIMPPLVYNASNPDPPEDPALETIALVRSVRVREDTIIRGTVQPKGTRASDSAATATNPNNTTSHSGVLDRIGGFFRRLFGVSR
jgi:hypothetical protein